MIGSSLVLLMGRKTRRRNLVGRICDLDMFNCDHGGTTTTAQQRACAAKLNFRAPPDKEPYDERFIGGKGKVSIETSAITVVWPHRSRARWNALLQCLSA